MTTATRILTSPISIVCILAVALTAVACDSDEQASVAPGAASNAAESNFVETVEAKRNEAIGIADSDQASFADDPIDIEGVAEAEASPNELEPPGATIAFSLADNIGEVPIKDVEIVAKEVTANDGISIEDEVSRQIIALEHRLMDIWDRSIDGVVLITLENSVFPTDGTGAGWFWDDQGHIVTNHHVVQPTSPFSTSLSGTNSIFVETFDGDRYEAEIIGSDPVADIAVLKIEADPTSYELIPVGNSANLRPGMTAIALGHPFGAGQAFSMTHGIISGLARSIRSESSTITIPAVIQTDADMNPGNSGGPLLNSTGEVIGVNTQIRSVSSTNSGVGFATPINLVRRVVDGLIENGNYEYPFIGISSWVVSPTIAQQLNLDDDQRGLLVTVVSPDGPAEKAGIVPDSGRYAPAGDGDIIVRIDNVQINDLYDLRSYILLNTSPGDEIVIEVLRDGEIVPISLTLGSWGDQSE